MAASNKTIQQVAAVLRDELSPEVRERIMRRLVDETSGNSSYRETVITLFRELLGYYPGHRRDAGGIGR